MTGSIRPINLYPLCIPSTAFHLHAEVLYTGEEAIMLGEGTKKDVTYCAGNILDIIANNPIDQKVVDLSSSQHYSLVENAIYRSVFPPQGV